ncbi:MAG: type IV secretory system conjugative DNA transfer family protein, partial [Actinobacteria bacterium]|nr:type IV secretory system conjugative DNA transfer family protein [Actinomycetota bacterium]
RSIMILGPSRSGKTSGLAIPAILEWDGPVVATSVKTDLVRDTAGWRATKGTVALYDPTGATGLAAASWSPLAGCTTWMGAVRTAHAMAATVKATGTAGGLTDGDFWYASAAKLLAPLLFAAAANDLPIASVVAWLDTQEERHVQTLLGNAGVPEAANAFAASTGRADNQKSSIYTTAETVLAAYEDPIVAASAATSDIDPDALLDGNHTLYLCAPRDDQRRLRPLFVGLLHQVLVAASRQAGRQPDGRLARPLLVVLDEAANIAPLPDLDEVASTAMGLGITLVTVWQDLAQIRARYHQRTATIVNNHAGMLVLRGMRDLDALTATSELLGRHTPPERPDERRTGPQPLLAAHALRSLPEGRAVAIYQHLPPFQVQLRPHYATRHLRRRAAIPPPAAPTVAPAAADPARDRAATPARAEGATSTATGGRPLPAPTLATVRAHAQDILAIARDHDATDVRVFGSVATGTAVPGSDLNLLVDIPPARRLLHLRAIGEQIAELVGVRVEVLTVDMLQNPGAALDALPLTPTLEPQR